MLFERRYHPSTDPDSEFSRVLAGGDVSTSGVLVTPESALRVTAWLACVRIISETAGSLPFITYKRLTRGKERAFDHYLYSILHDVPNPEMTAMTYRETITSHVASRGNGLSEVEFDRAGRVRALWPLNPDRVKLERRSGRLWYVVTLPNSVGGYPVGIPSERIFHVRWLTRNGLWGYSPTDLARESIGMAQAIQTHGASYFSNGAEPGVVLKHPKELGDKAYGRLRESWEERHQGLDKKHRVAILEDGMDIEKLGMGNEDSQFIQSAEMTVAEIARIFGISLDMLAINGASATYASVEAFGLRFVTYTMRPWFVRWEQEVTRSLLTRAERREYFAEHLVDALLRGDLSSRYEAFAKGITNGFVTINEAREAENRNPVEGGDRPMVQLNLAPLGYNPQQPTSQRSFLQAQRHTFVDVAQRVLRRQRQDVLALARRDGFTQALPGFYREHESFAAEQFEAVARTQIELWKNIVGRSMNDLEIAILGTHIARSIALQMCARDYQHVRSIDTAQFTDLFSAWCVGRAESFENDFDALNRMIVAHFTQEKQDE